MKLAASWSGGKDSVYACYRATKCNHEVEYLLNFISKAYQRCCFHGIEAGLMSAQARCVGIPMVQKEMSDDMEQYEIEFKEAANGLKAKGIAGMVFGDIYLDEHKQWVERVCGDIGMNAVEPLWKESTDKIVDEFIREGFTAVIVSCKKELGGDLIGRELDAGVMAELKKRGSCVCGENGEYHTFVVDGPMFNKRVNITKSAPLLRERFWPHWFLDIKEYEII
jgi:diphthine-ammonia ligase